MSLERFDNIAKALAYGTSRRQLLKGFAAGMSASILTTLGLGRGNGSIATASPAAAGENFLPFIRSTTIVNACPAASTCEEKVYCSEENNCRCIMSAEGELRCGTVPSCDIDRCTTSADCAHLGEGYFCDTPNSGCCSDGELQRCLAPCDYAISCPDARICGTTCCDEGHICRDGACVDSVAGTWDGTLTYEQQSIAIRFILARDEYELSGRLLLQDPVSELYLETGTIFGYLSESEGYWQTESGSQVAGEFSQESFAGTFTFVDLHDEFGLETTISLQRITAQ
jgi:hypothetical protein